MKITVIDVFRVMGVEPVKEHTWALGQIEIPPAPRPPARQRPADQDVGRGRALLRALPHRLVAGHRGGDQKRGRGKGPAGRPVPVKRMLTRQEVAEALRVTLDWVSRHCPCGYKIGRRMLYAQAEVASFMESHRCHISLSLPKRAAGRIGASGGRRMGSTLTAALELQSAR